MQYHTVSQIARLAGIIRKMVAFREGLYHCVSVKSPQKSPHFLSLFVPLLLSRPCSNQAADD